MSNTWRKHLKLSSWAAVIAILASLILLPYQLKIASMPTVPGIPMAVLLALSIFQTSVMVFVLSLLGSRLAEAVQLPLPILRGYVEGRKGAVWDKQSLLWSLGMGILVALLITVLDRYVFSPSIPGLVNLEQQVPRWYGLLTVPYGGIVEELMLRLGVMSMTVWLLAKITRSRFSAIPTWVYVCGIVLAAIVFGLLHLPATIQIFGELTPVLILRGILLNGIGGVVYGTLFWKRGLEYAMVAHMAGDVVLHVVF